MEELSQTPDRSLDDSHQSLLQLRGGDASAVGRLIGSVRPFLKYQVLEMLGPNQRSQEDASDVVQKALLQAVEQIDSFQGRTIAEWRAWLSAIARNKALDSHRYWSSGKRDLKRSTGGEAAIQNLASAEKSPSSVAIGSENSGRLELALQQLDPADRQIIELRQFEGLDHRAIAGRLGISEAASRQRWKTALERLRNVWKAIAGSASPGATRNAD